MTLNRRNVGRLVSYIDCLVAQDWIAPGDWLKKVGFESIALKCLGLMGCLMHRIHRRRAVDVLFLLQNDYTTASFRPVISGLEREGRSCAVERLQYGRARIKSFCFGFVPFWVPKMLAGSFSIASYFAEKYRPSLIICSDNIALYASVLRQYYNTSTDRCVASGYRRFD